VSRSLDQNLLLSVFRVCVWLVLLTVIFVPFERLFALHPKKVFRKAILTDVAYYFLNSLIPGFLLGAPVALLAWLVHHAIPGAFTSAVATSPLWIRIVAGFVVGDIGAYWGHRWSHEIPFLWRFHAIHHSAEHVDFLVSTRAHPVDMVFTRLCGLVPLYVLGLAAPRGIPNLVAVLVLLLGMVWGFFIHANVRWRFGPLEWLIATPAFHHWHHTNDGPDYVNKNYAALLPWVDRLFGTLYLPKDKQPVRYGIDELLPTHFLGQLVRPFLFSPGRTDSQAADPTANSSGEAAVVTHSMIAPGDYL
jgi:sterol desaturase/sphingolipid hydroxylase (fatty acid hydroxylase superfamily)